MNTEEQILKQEQQIEALLDQKWAWLMKKIRASKDANKNDKAKGQFAGEIARALDQQYSDTLDAILRAAGRESN